MGETWVRIPHDVQVVVIPVLVLAVIRFVNLCLMTTEQQKGEAMPTESEPAILKYRGLLVAIIETAWVYGVGVVAARPLPGRHLQPAVQHDQPTSPSRRSAAL
jgi:hypothetical protein